MTGTIHPDQILSNAGAREGDALVITKPLGTGVLSTGLKRGWLDASARDALVAAMVATNKSAAAACRAVGVHALTDVTGYGLLGHALEMAEASGVAIIVNGRSLPLLPGARDAVRAEMIPGGLVANRDWVARRVELAGVPDDTVALACDPQTSGGLLAALPAADAGRLVDAAAQLGVGATVVGEVVRGEPGTGVLLA